MALTQYDLVRCKDAWDLRTGDKVVATFSNKSDAVNGGKMKRMIGSEGGTVRVHTEIGGIEEERTYPSSRNPRKSPG
jgi:hypothetical protein